MTPAIKSTPFRYTRRDMMTMLTGNILCFDCNFQLLLAHEKPTLSIWWTVYWIRCKMCSVDSIRYNWNIFLWYFSTKDCVFFANMRHTNTMVASRQTNLQEFICNYRWEVGKPKQTVIREHNLGLISKCKVSYCRFLCEISTYPKTHQFSNKHGFVCQCTECWMSMYNVNSLSD